MSSSPAVNQSSVTWVPPPAPAPVSTSSSAPSSKVSASDVCKALIGVIQNQGLTRNQINQYCVNSLVGAAVVTAGNRFVLSSDNMKVVFRDNTALPFHIPVSARQHIEDVTQLPDVIVKIVCEFFGGDQRVYSG